MIDNSVQNNLKALAKIAAMADKTQYGDLELKFTIHKGVITKIKGIDKEKLVFEGDDMTSQCVGKLIEDLKNTKSKHLNATLLYLIDICNGLPKYVETYKTTKDNFPVYSEEYNYRQK